MKNFVQPGHRLTLPAPYDVASGGGFKVGSIVAIAAYAAASGADVEGVREGVFTHAKTSAQAWTQGATLYWDDTNKVFTTTASGNTKAGVAAKAADNPSETGVVCLIPTI